MGFHHLGNTTDTLGTKGKLYKLIMLVRQILQDNFLHVLELSRNVKFGQIRSCSIRVKKLTNYRSDNLLEFSSMQTAGRKQTSTFYASNSLVVYIT